MHTDCIHHLYFEEGKILYIFCCSYRGVSDKVLVVRTSGPVSLIAMIRQESGDKQLAMYTALPTHAAGSSDLLLIPHYQFEVGGGLL